PDLKNCLLSGKVEWHTRNSAQVIMIPQTLVMSRFHRSESPEAHTNYVFKSTIIRLRHERFSQLWRSLCYRCYAKPLQ
ncbi:8930_t:CDS:2, partial [Racocetra persica]